MIGFQGEVTLIPLSKWDIQRRGLPVRFYGEFQSDLVCESAFCGTFTIPKGFLSDGATIPKLFWNLLSDTDPNIFYPSLAHDFGYSTHGNIGPRIVTKDQVDQMLREQMKAVGAPAWQYDQVYWAVHWFGGFASTARLVGIKQGWNETTHPAKLRNTEYNFKPQVRSP
jgi:hypothetical protein